MIEGIEVLSVSEIYAVSSINFIIGIVFLIAMILFSIVAVKVKELWQCVIMTIITIICFCISIYYDVNINTKPTGKYEYKVTINDNVSFNDFYNKYEIINIEGKIYTIKEKK